MWRRRLSKPGFTLFIPMLLVLVLAVACGEDATSTPLATATPQPTATPTTPAVPPTATPVPATATPAPTSTPRPTPTPTPTPAPLPTPTPGFSTSKVDQLVVGVVKTAYEVNIPWKYPRINSELDSMFETLVALKQDASGYEARLATEWEMASDALSWTFQLRKDIPFQFGFGEFTSADVVHSWERLTSEESIAADITTWRKMVGKADDIQVLGDYEVMFNLAKPEPDLEFHLSTLLGNYYIVSKAQWDAEGEEGMIKRPATTGSYRYKERKLGEGIILERVEDHWRRTPDFKELRRVYAPEEATRLAMLLTEEGHIVSLAMDLHEEAVSRGHKVIKSVTTVLPAIMFFGGLHYITPDKFDPDEPFTNVKVREAMNRAIDRELINDTLFFGNGRFHYFHYNHPSQPGWDPEFETLAPELYSYDPDRARELLVEAGYPDGFELGLHLVPWGTMPEFVPMQEAIAGMWEDIGIKVNRIEVEYSRLRPDIKSKSVHGRIWGWPAGPPRPPNAGYMIMYGRDADFSAYESATFDPNMDELQETADPLRRDELQATLGRELMTQYTTMPVVALPVIAVVNPEVVKDWVFPGPYYGFSHLEYVEAAQ